MSEREKSIMEEREIDLLDMIADILSHWKGLLIALVIGAVLLGGFSYVRSYRNAQDAQAALLEDETEIDAETVEEQLAQLEEDLDDGQKAAILTTIDDEREYALKKKYSEESVYMQMDPFNITQMQLSYQINPGDNSQLQSLGSIYDSVINNIGLYDWIEKKTGIQSAYARELVSVRAGSSTPFINGDTVGTFGTDNLKITIIQADEKSCKELAKVVKSYVEDQKEQLVEEIGEHELILLSETTGTLMSTDLLNQQVNYGNAISSMRSTIASAKAGFTEEQAEYYNLLTKKEGLDRLEIETDEETDAEEPVIESPSVSKKYVLLGAVLFAFIYAGILFLAYIFNSKIRVSDELQTLYHIPQIGVVVKDDAKKKFIVDKWIDDLRHYGKRRFTAEQSLELAFTAVKIAAAKNGLNNICLMGCNLSAGAGKVCESLKAALEKESITVTVLDNVLYDAEAMEKVDAMTGVVLVEKAGSTLYNEVASELALLKRQDIAVLGGIVVE